MVGDSSGEVTVIFHHGYGGADIQHGQLLRTSGKARQAGQRELSMVDPAYEVIEDPAREAEESGDSEEAGDSQRADKQ